jgi:hypothetical protein
MSLTAETILAVTPRTVGQLFGATTAPAKKKFTRLMAAWHPDTCKDPRASDVFAHIMSLRDGTAPAAGPSGRVMRKADGSAMQMRPLRNRATDVGELIVLSRTFAQRYTADFADLAQVEAGIASQFTYADDKMQAQMAPSLPRVLRSVALTDAETLVIGQRDPGEVFLSDLMARYGAIADRHVAWICSGIMNIAAYLTYTGLVHGAIGPETVLVDPETHSVRLAAGWGFATRVGNRPKALPIRTLDLLPRLAVKGQVADARVDMELVRHTVREALGDPRGSNGGVAALPVPLSRWINLPPAADAVTDYKAWQKALVDAWGPRTFIKAPYSAGSVYQNGA